MPAPTPSRRAGRRLGYRRPMRPTPGTRRQRGTSHRPPSPRPWDACPRAPPCPRGAVALLPNDASAGDGQPYGPRCAPHGAHQASAARVGAPRRTHRAHQTPRTRPSATPAAPTAPRPRSRRVRRLITDRRGGGGGEYSSHETRTWSGKNPFNNHIHLTTSWR